MNRFLINAVLSLVSNAQFVSNETRILEWHDIRPQPTEEAIQAKITELQAAEPLRQLRIQRDQLLSSTDWWCVSDRTATAEQLQYRQALRDLPSTASPALDEDGNLTGVTWPEKPAT